MPSKSTVDSNNPLAHLTKSCLMIPLPYDVL